MKQFTVLVSLFIIAVVIAGAAQSPDLPGQAQVVAIVDGDTFDARLLLTGQVVRIRIVGIDAPEVARDGRPAEIGAAEATDALRAAIAGRLVSLAFDTLSNREDRYGRLLCYVSLEGRDVGRQLLLEGHAVVMERYAFDRYRLYKQTLNGP